MPLTDFSAGSVMRPPMTAAQMTALAGVRLEFTFDQIREPGTARSRLNANIIREVDVRHAVAQKSCALAEMKSSVPAQFAPREVSNTYATPPAGMFAYCGS